MSCSLVVSSFLFFFVFQAEAVIRDVTEVKRGAIPVYVRPSTPSGGIASRREETRKPCRAEVLGTAGTEEGWVGKEGRFRGSPLP